MQHPLKWKMVLKMTIAPKEAYVPKKSEISIGHIKWDQDNVSFPKWLNIIKNNENHNWKKVQTSSKSGKGVIETYLNLLTKWEILGPEVQRPKT